MDQPLVSVIIPTYKRSDFLCTTIDSVLAQTYPNIEIIVVDDNGLGTTFQQATEKRLLPYIRMKQINYICHEVNKNGSAARNTGFRASHGEYINFLDDDDELLLEKIDKQVSILQNAELKYGAVYCNSIISIQSFTRRKKNIRTKSLAYGNICREYLMNECPFNTSTILFRRSVIENLNGFDESFVRHQDYELMTRFFNNYEILPTGIEPLVCYDLTKDRTNTPNPKMDFEIKEKFINEFSDSFEKWGYKNTICHYMWVQCALGALLSKNRDFFKKAIINSISYAKLNMKDYLLILKYYIVGLLK